MAFCKYCGKPVDNGVKFCPNCGAAVDGAASGAQNTAPNVSVVNSAGAADGGYDPADIEKTRLVCAISYISILFFLPIVVYPESRFGKFHANQALLLLIASVIIGTVCGVPTGIINAIPLIPGFIKAMIGGALSVAGSVVPLAGMIFGIVNALNGKAAPLPLIGNINLINK